MTATREASRSSRPGVEVIAAGRRGGVDPGGVEVDVAGAAST